MKTVKIRVVPCEGVEAKVEQQLRELEWVWNKARFVALHNHCIEWRKWALKQTKKKSSDFYNVDFEGCIDTPLFFSRRGAWNFATCRIADGGPYWKKAEPGELGLLGQPLVAIAYIVNGQTKYAKPRKLVEGDKPYALRTIEPHECPVIGGKAMKKVADLDSKTALNVEREAEGLTPLTCHSDFVGGLLKDFEVAWKAYLDPSLSNRSQPFFKDGDRRKLQTLSNAQNPPKLDQKKGVFVAGGLHFQPVDRSWQKRLGNQVMRSFKLIRKPSGWYLCVSVCSEMQAFIPTLRSQANKLGSTIKKEVTATYPHAKGKELKALVDEAKSQHADYQKAQQDLEDAQHAVALETHEAATYRYRTGRKAGVDPGVKAVVSTSQKGKGGGLQFRPNEARQRVKIHVAKLQRKLDIKRNSNDRRTGLIWKKGERPATQKEAALQVQIQRLQERSQNSSNAFNHKLSTKLAEGYDAIAWEDTQIRNMVKASAPKLAATGTYYERNMAKAKSGLSESLLLASLGDLKAKTRAKVELVGKTFVDVPAQGTSITCNFCGNTAKQQRWTQALFQCLNPECPEYLKEKNADVNAADNIFDKGLG